MLFKLQNGHQNFDFFFSIAIGADYSIYFISVETYAPQFIGHNKLFLGIVKSPDSALQ